MRNFNTRVYSIADFEEWYNNDLLELSPDFQRRAVWSEIAKSYLIDTIMKSKPIPKLVIMQELRGARPIRVVVDGQQRLRAILGFMNGGVKLSRAHSVEYAGSTFDTLPSDIQKAFREYELGVDLLYDMPYEDILDIFARINTYTVTLNTQELMNTKYLGFFKQMVYKYGYKYLGYFIDGNILTKARITRMAEAELSADLLTALISGVQTTQNVEANYRKFEESEENLPEIAKQFDKIMSYVGDIYPPDDIAQTNWARTPLFYTLFTSIAHCLFGLKNLDPDLRVSINPKMVHRLRVIFDDISSKYDAVVAIIDDKKTPIAVKVVPEDYERFIDYSRRRTTNTEARVARSNLVCEKIKSSIM